MNNLYSSVIEFIDLRIKSQSSSALSILWAMEHHALMINAYTIDSQDKVNSADTRLDTMLEGAALSCERIIRMKSLIWLRRRVMAILEEDSTDSDVISFITRTKSHICTMMDFDFYNTGAGRRFSYAINLIDDLSSYISEQMNMKEKDDDK